MLSVFVFQMNSVCMESPINKSLAEPWMRMRNKLFCRWANSYTKQSQSLQNLEKLLSNPENTKKVMQDLCYCTECMTLQQCWFVGLGIVCSIIRKDAAELFPELPKPRIMGSIAIGSAKNLATFTEIVSNRILEKSQKEIAKRETVKNKHKYLLEQRRDDNRKRQQELKHQQKINTQKGKKLPKAQQRMQVAHRKRF